MGWLFSKRTFPQCFWRLSLPLVPAYFVHIEDELPFMPVAGGSILREIYSKHEDLRNKPIQFSVVTVFPVRKMDGPWRYLAYIGLDALCYDREKQIAIAESLRELSVDHWIETDSQFHVLKQGIPARNPSPLRIVE